MAQSQPILVVYVPIYGTYIRVMVSVKSQPHKWHIWFFPTQKPTLKKPKEPFFANAQTGQLDNYSNIFYLEKRDNKKIKTKFVT